VRVQAVVVMALVLAGVDAAGAQTWREVRGENFIVVSDSSERRVRSIAWQFEQMRAAVAEGLPWVNLNLDRPVYVIAARDENGMRALAPQYWEQRGGIRPASVFVSSQDAHYIALRADTEVTDQLQNPHATAYWAYSALVLQRSMGGRLPLWVVNGLAGVLSNTIVRPRGVEFGRPQPWMAERAKEGPRLPLPQLLAVTHASPEYRSGIARERFDAQTWALVQFMIFGLKDNAGPRFDQLIQRLAAGVPSEEAIASVYGSVAALDEAYQLYVHQSVYSFGTLPTSTAIVEDKMPSRVADPAEHATIRAAFHVAMNRPVEARVLLAAARKASPESGTADSIEALLLEREKQTDQARELMARAAARNTTSYWTYYRLATMHTNGPMTAADQATVEPWLERATTLNPRFGPAWAFLSDIQASRRRTPEAIESARRALDLDRSEISHYLRLTRLLMMADRVDEAKAVAQQAAPLATPQQRQTLESLVNRAAN